MNHSNKQILIAGIILVVCGIALSGIGYMAGGGKTLYIDNSGVHVKGKMEQNQNMRTISKELENFQSIDADLDLYNVDLIPSDHYGIQAVYNTRYGQPIIKVENDTLVVKEKSRVRFHIDIFGFTSNWQKQSVKIYYPKTAKLKDVIIREGSDVAVKDLTAEKVEFNVDLGKLKMDNIAAKNLKVEMDSGDCTLHKIKADDLIVKNDLGKTTLEDAILKQLKIEADSGDITISNVKAEYSDLNLDLGNLSTKNFVSNGMKAVADSGNMDFRGTLLGKTDITCDLGNVTVYPGASKEQFNYKCSADLGEISIDGDHASGSISSSNDARNTLNINVDSGNIKIEFN